VYVAINILLGFGCRILAYDVAQNPALVGRAGRDLAWASIELFADSDIISFGHAPLLPTTTT